MLYRLAHLAATGEPLTGTQMGLGRSGRFCGALQHQRQRLPQAKPLTAIVDLPNEELERLEDIEDFATNTVEHMVAELCRETRPTRQCTHGPPHVTAQPSHDLTLDVIPQQWRPGNQTPTPRPPIGGDLPQHKPHR